VLRVFVEDIHTTSVSSDTDVIKADNHNFVRSVYSMPDHIIILTNLFAQC